MRERQEREREKERKEKNVCICVQYLKFIKIRKYNTKDFNFNVNETQNG
jgi:hypothetical protein